MPQHIGIAACSAEGAALCYRTVCTEGGQLLGPHAHPEISMHTRSFELYVKCIRRDDWQGAAELILPATNKLAKAGADFRCLGVLGTRSLVDSEIYSAKLAAHGLACVRRNTAEREEVSRIIMEELACGVFKPEAVAYHQPVIERMKGGGCDAVVLSSEILLIDHERLELAAADARFHPLAHPGRAAPRHAGPSCAGVNKLPEGPSGRLWPVTRSIPFHRRLWTHSR